jgi:hypothetical protein
MAQFKNRYEYKTGMVEDWNIGIMGKEHLI